MTVNTEKIQLGVCDVTFNGTDLGATKGGVEVELTTETYEVKVDQLGESVAKEFILGTMVTVTVPLAETDLARLQSLLPQSVMGSTAPAPTGTWTASVSGAVGDTSITVSPGTGTPVPGQTFQFEGHTTTYRVVSYNAPTLTFVQHDKGTGGLVAPVVSAEDIVWFARPAGVEVRTGLNIDLFDHAYQLKLHPTGVDESDTENDFIVYKAAPNPNFTFRYATGEEKVYEVQFKGYPDTANNNRVASFGAPSA